MTRWAKDVRPDNVLPEYPRPQMVRKRWQNLNGLWDYAIRPKGESQPAEWDGKILVPFAAESALSGVMKDVGKDNRLWYRRTFTVPQDWKDQRVLLHFGAVDWETTVWVNGKEVRHPPRRLRPVHVRPRRRGEARRRQRDRRRRLGPHRRRRAAARQAAQQAPRHLVHAGDGIWQTVWIEPVPKTRVESLRITPKIEGQDASIRIEAHWGGTGRTRLRALGDPGGSRCRGQTRCVNVDRFIRR
jgi:hypothetical protein